MTKNYDCHSSRQFQQRARLLYLVHWLLIMILSATIARAQLTERYVGSFRGSFTIIGNPLGQEAAGGTPAPIVGTIGATGSVGTADTAPDVFWRSDSPSDGQAEANTSITAANARTTAVLNLPAGAVVKKAFLYWGAYAPVSGSTTATLDRPGIFSQSLTSDHLFVAGNPVRYNAEKDVTDLVLANGNGAYRLSGVTSPDLVDITDSNRFTGWSLLVIYELASEPYRVFEVKDGIQPVANGLSATNTLNLFNEVNGEALLGVVGYDGDNPSTGDALTINGTPFFDNLNPVNNFFNSTRSTKGSAVSEAGDLPQLTGAPQSMSGMDIDILDVAAYLAPGATSYTVVATTTGDVFFFGMMVSAVATLAPEINLKGNGNDIADGGTSPSPTDNTDMGSVLPGNNVTKEFVIQNTDLGALQVTNITLTGANAAEFTLVSPPAFPLSIPANGSQTITVQFTPTATGDRFSTLTIFSKDADEAEYDVQLKGTGSSPCTTPTAFALTGGGAYCAENPGPPIGLTDSEPGVNYQLKKGDANVGDPVAGTGEAISFGNQTEAGTYTVVATTATGGCMATMTGSATVSINPASVGGSVGGGTVVCAGTNSTLLTLSEQAGSIIKWQSSLNSDFANPTNIDNTTTTLTVANLTVTTYYRAVVQNGECSSQNSSSATITTVAPPTANAGPDKTTCGQTAVTLAASGSGSWSGGTGSFSNASSPTSTYTPSAGEVGTIVTLIWTSGGPSPVRIGSPTANTAVSGAPVCPPATDQMTVTVVTPTTANAGLDKAGCAGTPVSLAAVVTNVAGLPSMGQIPEGPSGEGTWSGGAGSFSNTHSPTSTYTPTEGEAGTTLTLTWTITGTAPCANASDQMVVTVYARPTATIAGSTVLCQNSASPSITATGSGGSAPYSFTYKINGGESHSVATSGDNNTATVIVPTNAAGTFTYSLISVSDVHSCIREQTGSATVTILPVHLISLTSATKSPLGCLNTTITPITFALGGGATGATILGLPTGVTGSVTNGVLTISGTPSVSGTFNYSITTTGSECSAAHESGTITLNSKPIITLSVNGQTFNEGNNQVLCDTDANPSNTLTPAITTGCVSGSVVWRVQIGAGVWSEWSSTAPSSQPSDNVAYHYQAACGGSCPSSYTNPIVLTINYRSATPQNVSLIADGTTVTAGQSATICDAPGNTIAFNATCAAGEVLLYSVDGGNYSSTIPSQIVDGNFHNYRVRCHKADGTLSCVETESAVMSLRISNAPAAPIVSITPTSGCGTPAVFSGSSTCAGLVTLWYNATTNQALTTLPTQTPNATTSYYARCQNTASAGEAGCLSEKSNVVTFTITPVNDAPTVSVSAELVCAGTSVTVSTSCPAGASVLWNTGVTEASFQVAFNNVTKATYTARCVFANGCQSPLSAGKTVTWKGFDLTFINVGSSQSGIKAGSGVPKSAWSSQFITPDAGPVLDYSTEANPTIYYSENVNKMAPRFWTIHAETCNLGTNGSLTFDMLATPEVGIIRSYNTHENNAPYLMYANRDGFTELYAQNHPLYGFFADNGSGGNTYDAGLPKGLYKLGVRYWDQKGQGSIYPSTRQPAGNVLAYQEYWFRIQSSAGVGTGASRISAETIGSSFAQVAPNPLSQVLRLKISEAQGQKVSAGLMDASGRTLLQRSFVPQTNQHQEEFEVSQLANGMYFLQVKMADKQTTLKVIKVQ